ncbi:hypothetical protein PRIPAC_79890, partial [Pristionchus pacificus]|uniref:Uncharacterized protein n=1 Tax=Pristionchus pacificus TaxID=54126 RepID=A0A2A6CNH1_PRIPA
MHIPYIDFDRRTFGGTATVAWPLYGGRTTCFWLDYSAISSPPIYGSEETTITVVWNYKIVYNKKLFVVVLANNTPTLPIRYGPEALERRERPDSVYTNLDHSGEELGSLLHGAKRERLPNNSVGCFGPFGRRHPTASRRVDLVSTTPLASGETGEIGKEEDE